MLEMIERNRLIGRPVRLAFRTTHIDKAGETWDVKILRAELLEIDVAGEALLISDDGVHLRVPVAHLYPLLQEDGGTGEMYGVQEVIRDFHNAYSPVKLRWLDRSAALHQFEE